MGRSIGLLEFKSIAKGIQAADEMVKSANVELILSTPLCPGKYIIMLSGDVGAVTNAVQVGRDIGLSYLISDYVIANVHEKVFPAITATADYDEISSIGIVETISAVAAIIAGDTALKAANVDLLEVRVARGLGGKGFILITGEVSAVKAAVEAAETRLAETGDIITTVVIPSPSKELIPTLL
ncbi:BMC domain-containing protein [Clostridium uliginosum]|uniref:Carboxysome shell and ethanolamine utilization microcompartment protein CcmL/EutN n=1 Tax=Clostridium uliginosum TaxID=119641 RepID=A0A1I1H373_9CLOT|nr:BMC domain-containing protein [Clostridium uliginosum]SFC18467.1 Carboxysome shell and ethanolamine utilization microcompartment protein CcmL/EutN [Clostridium uliginosum]